MKQFLKELCKVLCLLSMFTITGFALMIRTNAVDVGVGVGLLLLNVAILIVALNSVLRGDF